MTLQVPGENRHMPCGCRVWRYGGAQGVDTCVEHFHRHLRRNSAEDWKATRRQCGCLRCRARARGLSPWQYTEELARQQLAQSRGASAPATPPDSVEMHACGCCLETRGESKRFVPCEQHFIEKRLGVVREQRRIAEENAEFERAIVAHNRKRPASAWRRFWLWLSGRDT